VPREGGAHQRLQLNLSFRPPPGNVWPTRGIKSVERGGGARRDQRWWRGPACLGVGFRFSIWLTVCKRTATPPGIARFPPTARPAPPSMSDLRPRPPPESVFRDAKRCTPSTANAVKSDRKREAPCAAPGAHLRSLSCWSSSGSWSPDVAPPPCPGKRPQVRQTVQCASNLRQLATGWQMYANANRRISAPGRLPTFGAPGGCTTWTTNAIRPRWYELLAPCRGVCLPQPEGN